METCNLNIIIVNEISCFVLSRVSHFLEFEIFTADVETEYCNLCVIIVIYKLDYSSGTFIISLKGYFLKLKFILY